MIVKKFLKGFMAAALAVTMAVTPVSSVKAGDTAGDTSHGDYDQFGNYWDYELGHYYDPERYWIWLGVIDGKELPPCRYDSNGNDLLATNPTDANQSVTNPTDESQSVTNFDAEYYAQTYPDVANAVGTDRDALYNHYVTFGKAEGRLACAPTV